MAEEPITPRRGYLSFLLRLWLESGGDAPLWRVSLERPQDGERLGFASLEDLVAFVEGETGARPPELQRSDVKDANRLQYRNSRDFGSVCSP